MCRSRRELSNAYLLAKIGVDTAENEPLEVWEENSIQYSLHSLKVAHALARQGWTGGPVAVESLLCLRELPARESIWAASRVVQLCCQLAWTWIEVRTIAGGAQSGVHAAAVLIAQFRCTARCRSDAA